MLGWLNGQTAGIAAVFSAWRKIDTQFSPAASTASVTFETSGSISGVGSAPGSSEGTPFWYYGTPGSYWIRVTATSGSFTSGTTGSWLALSSARAYVKTVSAGGGSSDVVFDVEISSDSGGVTIVASSTGWMLSANAEI